MSQFNLNAILRGAKTQEQTQGGSREQTEVRPAPTQPVTGWDLGAIKKGAQAMGPVTPSAGREARPADSGFLGGTGDFMTELLAGGAQGFGLAVEGLGNLGQAADRQFDTGGDQSASSYVSRGGRWVQRKADQFSRWSMDERTRQALETSQIKGTLWKPNTWDFGEDPSLKGVGVQVSRTLGQLAPIIAAGVASGGVGAAGVGGLQSGEAGRDYVEGEIQEAYDAGIIETAVPRWSELKREGMTDVEALRRIKDEAGDVGQLLTMPIGALGGLATQKIVSGLTGRSLIKGVLLGAAEEGGQEVAESAAAKGAVDLTTEITQDYGEGTFADFFLGAVAGGTVGGVGSRLAPPNEDFELAPTFSDEELGVQEVGPVAPDGGGVAPTLPSVNPENTPKTTPGRGAVGGDTPEATSAQTSPAEDVIVLAEPPMTGVVRVYHGGDTGGTNTFTTSLERAKELSQDGTVVYTDLSMEDSRVEAAALSDLQTDAEFTMTPEEVRALGGVKTYQVPAAALEDAKFNTAQEKVPPVTKQDVSALVRFDNPGGRWLEGKVQRAQEGMQDPEASSVAQKGLQGSPTAYTQEPVEVSTEALTSIPGANNEVSRAGEPKFDELQRSVQEEGFKNEFPILVRVNHLGEPYIMEGNNRVAVAAANRVPSVPVRVEWMNGAETAQGTFTPQSLLNSLTSQGRKTVSAQRQKPQEGEVKFSTDEGDSHRIVQYSDADLAALEAELDRFGLKDLVNINSFPLGTFKNNLTGANIVGGFARDLRGYYILIANSLPSEYSVPGVFRHELIHALKSYGFFNSGRGKRYWKVLTSRVRSDGISQHIKENYDPADHTEEAIALMVEAWTQGELQNEGILSRALKAIHDVVEAFGNFFRGQGFTTAEQVMEEMFGSRHGAAWLAASSDKFQNSQMHEFKAASAAIKKYGGKLNVGQKDYFTRLTKYGETVLQLANKNLHVPWLQNYTQRARLWHASKTKTLHAANDTVGKWNRLGVTQARALSRTLLEVDRMAYRTQEELDKGVVRHPTKDELLAIFKKHGLSQEGIKVYVQVRKDFENILNRMEQTIITSIDHTTKNMVDESGMGSSVQADIDKLRVKKEFEQLRKAPYFPHSRFGTYTIVVTDSSGKRVYVEAFESIKERDAKLVGVQKKFPHAEGFNVARGKFSEEQKVYQGLPYSLLVQMKEVMNLTEKQQKALDELIQSALPAQSFKNHFVKRDDTAGYSQDALRAYADYFLHGANHLARIEFSPLMEEDILAGDADVVGLQGTHGADATKRSQIRDFIKSHLDELNNPTNDWAALRSVGFFWWLGFNVKSAVLNLTQVPMVSYSHLATQFNDPKALAALTRQTATIQKGYRTPKKAKTPEQLRIARLVERGIDEGFLDESFAAELAGLAEGANLTSSLAKSKLRASGQSILHYSGYMFQATEKLNRRITFMTALDLAQSNRGSTYHQEVAKKFGLEIDAMVKEGWSREEAVDFYVGKDAVESTQFNYSAWARPAIMRGRKSAFLTFFMFTQNMLWFIANNPGRTRYLLTLLLFAGVMGMPGAEDLSELASAVGTRIMGKAWSPEKELRKLVLDHFGDDFNPDLFMHGISRYGFGLPQLGDMMGLPLPSTDMSGNIGMGAPLPVISPLIQTAAEASKPGAMDFEQAVGRFTMEGVGATLGIPLKILDAAYDTRLGVVDPKRWEKAAPASIANFSKALRFWAEGEERNRSGARVLEFDRNNPAHMSELVAQFFGFYPTRRAQQWDRVMALGEVQRFWSGRRGILYNQWDSAMRMGDQRDRSEVWRAVQRYNKQVPYPELRIDRKDLNRSFKSRERSRGNTESLTPNFKKTQRAVDDALELYPSSFDEKVPSGN